MKAHHLPVRVHQLGCPLYFNDSTAANCTCEDSKVKYTTQPIAAMKTVDKQSPKIFVKTAETPVNPAAMMAGTATPLADIIEVPVQEGCKAADWKDRGTDVAFRKIFEVNGHNYLFTSKCCMDCIKVKHKNMLRAYLIDHGAAPGLRLWWKVWRAIR